MERGLQKANHYNQLAEWVQQVDACRRSGQKVSENGLDPYRYLTWLLSSAAEMDLTQPDVVQALLPWNAPASCKA